VIPTRVDVIDAAAACVAISLNSNCTKKASKPSESTEASEGWRGKGKIIKHDGTSAGVHESIADLADDTLDVTTPGTGV
jgi:hypothetical protein